MWWDSLDVIQKIFFCIAVPASVLLIIQIVLMLIGLDGEGDGFDFNGDGVDVDFDAGNGISLFTVKGLTAFFSVGGWVGFTFSDGNILLAITAAVLSGTGALLLMAFSIKWVLGLQSSGNIRLADGIGQIAEVYLTIPPKNQGEGKINFNLNERFVEMSAVQEGDTPIKTGFKVKIVGLQGNTYTVECDF